MSKAEFIDNSSESTCHVCRGSGEVSDTVKCKACKGTGKCKEDSYILVAETPTKQKIAFQVDGFK